MSTSTTSTAIVDPKVEQSFEIIWLLFHAYLLFFLQCGLALIEAGNVRVANAKQVPFKALLVACVCGLVWFLWGHPTAYGEKGAASNIFIGGKDWAMTEIQSSSPTSFAFWLLQWGLAMAAAAITTGALAERCRLASYMIASVMMAGLVYPVVVHWAWSSEGWLSARRDAGGPLLGGNGLIDMAGSGVIHLTAGCAALMGAYFIGPRQGRFHTDGTVLPILGSSAVLSSLGTMFVWFAWFGLAPGNSWLMTSSLAVGSKVAVTTALAASAAGLSSLGLSLTRKSHLDAQVMLDGIRAGLVAISAAAAVVEPFAAVVIGLVAGGVYVGSAAAVVQLQVDDPTSSAAVHLLPGIWGLVAPGLFATKDNLQRSGYLNPAGSYGMFYGGDGKQLGIQLLGAASIAIWSTAVSAVTFYLLRSFKLLRLHVSEELTGLQLGVMGGNWRYRAEQAEGSFEGGHPSLVPCKADGSVLEHHTFLADEGAYYEEDEDEDDSDMGEHGAVSYGPHGGRMGGRGGMQGALRREANIGPTARTGSQSAPGPDIRSLHSSTNTSDTSQQQPSFLSSHLSLGPRLGSRLVVQVDARSASK